MKAVKSRGVLLKFINISLVPSTYCFILDKFTGYKNIFKCKFAKFSSYLVAIALSEIICHLQMSFKWLLLDWRLRLHCY